MLVSISVFILGSLACAVAPTMPLLIAGGRSRGSAAAGSCRWPQTVIADLFQPARTPRRSGYSSTIVHDAAVGPILGGFFHRSPALVVDLLDHLPLVPWP